ncbi:MAG: pyridoxamine 5'-phosphate oxidase family protein [Beijerinckiaceae bacterium]|nr:pyridoxamine 5'-phosphate oxidase family protein [Beijerinckiaceae bacterium]
MAVLPGMWREWVAEKFLRREGAPGPAAEHVFQYLLGAAKPHGQGRIHEDATVAKGADNFYERQYRQYFNPAMGAFAMTATQALLASSGPPRGLLWGRYRKTSAAMLEENGGALPILVLSRQTAAVPLLLPRPNDQTERSAIGSWLCGQARMPMRYRQLVAGEEVHCAEPHVRSRERSADGALLEVVDCAVRSTKLALLALHPHDLDAMGLHITLFGVAVLTPEQLESDYGLGPDSLSAWRCAASRSGSMLMFCAGATEEVFTQCSQNLFIKRPVSHQARRARAAWPNAWSPVRPLESLLAMQFESLQVTVSASGLPGASPRNGGRGKALFLGRRGGKAYLLIPYYPGNAVHGHAAKLWSNPYGSIMIYDDHSALSAVTISGPSRVLTHERVRRDFPATASEAGGGGGDKQTAAHDPEYWFLQEVAEIVQQSEPLAANSLDPARPSCSISAGGEARHGKKPAYFAANTLPPYDQHLQHKREKAGRPLDPSGGEHGRWNECVRSALEARRVHLDRTQEW